MDQRQMNIATLFYSLAPRSWTRWPSTPSMRWWHWSPRCAKLLTHCGKLVGKSDPLIDQTWPTFHLWRNFSSSPWLTGSTWCESGDAPNMTKLPINLTDTYRALLSEIDEFKGTWRTLPWHACAQNGRVRRQPEPGLNCTTTQLHSIISPIHWDYHLSLLLPFY